MYASIQNANQIKIKHTNQKVMALSIFRVLSFALFIGLFFVELGNFAFPLIFGAFVLFLILVSVHSGVQAQLRFLQAKDQAIENEKLKKNNRFETFEAGETFLDSGHPFASDLNVVGDHSLFQHINRSGSYVGQWGLKNILFQNMVSPKEVRQRQELIKELEKHPEWLLEWQAHSMLSQKKKLENNWHKAYRSIQVPHHLKFTIARAILITAITTLSFVHTSLAVLCGFMLIILNSYLNRKAKKWLLAHTQSVDETMILTSQMLSVGQHIQKMPLDMQLWQTFRTRLETGGGFVPNTQKLRKILNTLFFSLLPVFGSSSNAFYQVANYLVALDFVLVRQLLKWMDQNQKHVTVWLDTLAELEGMCSLTSYNLLARDKTVFPELSSEKFVIRGEAVVHPLLHKERIVSNPIELKSVGEIITITGSNMSGKSTFLRSVGVNLILAKAGSRVFADALTFYPHALFTSFSVQDDLSEGVSSFKAEVLRLKQMIEMIDDGSEPLFLLDEILRGTNSQDRINSCFELVQKLNHAQSFGFISTHDLLLPEKLEALPGNRFQYFSSEIREGQLFFPFTIHDGICPETNGYFLMKHEGVL